MTKTNEQGAESPERSGLYQEETEDKHCLFYSFASEDIPSRAGRAHASLKQTHSIWLTRSDHSPGLQPSTSWLPVNSHTQNGHAALALQPMTLKCLMLAEQKTGSTASTEIPMALEFDWLSLAKRFHSENRKE